MMRFFKGVAALMVGALLIACDNNTPLMERVVKGDIKGVEAELAKGGDIEAHNNFRWTALTHAARLGDVAMVKLLIEKGANVNAIDDTSWSPLMRTAMKGHVEVAKLLLAHGADIHHVDNGQWTALHWAAQQDDSEMMRVLLDAGADINAQTRDGRTPRMVAQSEGHTDLVNLISRWMNNADGTKP